MDQNEGERTEATMATPSKNKIPPTSAQVESFETVMVKLPNPLPKGLKVVYSQDENRYTLAATSKRGLKTLLDLAFSGTLL